MPGNVVGAPLVPTAQNRRFTVCRGHLRVADLCEQCLPRSTDEETKAPQVSLQSKHLRPRGPASKPAAFPSPQSHRAEPPGSEVPPREPSSCLCCCLSLPWS